MRLTRGTCLELSGSYTYLFRKAVFCLLWQDRDLNCFEIRTIKILRNETERTSFWVKISTNTSLDLDVLRVRNVTETITKGAPVVRFSKVPETFRSQKAMAKSQTLWLQSCFIHTSIISTEIPFIQEVSGVYTYPFWDKDELKES